MNANAREKLFKSWTGVGEVALIKEVATKGEHIQLCIEYLANKRKLPVPDYEVFFHDVVQKYVERLLSERLIYKSEHILKNVQRDVRCFYYQFACECDNGDLREMIHDYLRNKDPHAFETQMRELQFYWELLQQVQQDAEILAKCKRQLRFINLETLMCSEQAFRQRLIVELYFSRRNPELLQHLNKFIVWSVLVETHQELELIKWCCFQACDTEHCPTRDELEQKFREWTLQPEMYDFALVTLSNPGEVLRNCFAKAGYFFSDERDDVPALMRRICTSESFTKNRQLLEKLPIGRFLLHQGLYFLMLCDFVNAREIEELADRYPEKKELLKLIIALKNCKIETREGFEKIAFAAKIYLECQNVDFQNEQPLVTFFEFLCNEPTVPTLNCFLFSSTLKSIPYLKSVAMRFESNVSGSNLPTPYDFLYKFKHIDLKSICKDTEDVPSFSNERLCQKYGRKYQLNFLHYLKQQRSAYSVYYLLTEYLQHYAQITTAQLYSACEAVTELVLQHASNEELVTHCVAFNEMIGFDTQYLRNFLKLWRFLGSESPCGYGMLITQVERVLATHLAEQPNDFPLAEYQAMMRINQCHQYRDGPDLLMLIYANDDNWWCLLVLVQYFDVPLTQLRQLIDHFKTRVMGVHLLRALSHEPSLVDRNVKRHSSFSRKLKQARLHETIINTSVENVTSSLRSCPDANNIFLQSTNSTHMRFLADSSSTLDLFAILLLNSSTTPDTGASLDTVQFLDLVQSNHNGTLSTVSNLMKNCLKFKLPILAVLACTINDTNVDWNWLLWLTVSTNQWTELLCKEVGNNQELAWQLIESSVILGHAAILHKSFCIFYKDNPINHLFSFLHHTQQSHDFSDNSVHELRLFLLAWSNDEIQLPLRSSMKRNQLMQNTTKLLLLHLQHSFDSIFEQQKLLDCICKSGMSDMSGLLDFCLLNAVFDILQMSTSLGQRFSINFTQLLQKDNKEYKQLLSTLLDAKEYEMALRLATLLNLPVCDTIVYTKWVANMDENILEDASLTLYEEEIVEHALPPEILVNFFLYAAARVEEFCTRKYLLLKRALNVIKKNHLFPNESFNRDQIEYEMVACYLQIEDVNELEPLEVYHSEYYEQIMLQERCVLYKSFLELKELAGIEDLTTSLKTELSTQMQQRLETLLNRLLDEGDIVEALRLQELFEWRPIDLRFVVFCMALAEGVTTIFSMSSDERQLLCDIEKSSHAKFNKRTLNPIRNSGSHQSYSPLKTDGDFSDSCSTLEFEEIPSKEKRETLETIQGIASKLKYGIDIAKRIIMAYRAAMYLDKEYLDVLRTKDNSILLKSVSEEGCLHRLLVVNDILTSTRMTAQEIAEFLSFEITTAVVRPRFYIFSADQHAKNKFKNADLWGYNIDRDLHLFLELTPNTTKLGSCLLEYCDALKTYRKFQDNKPYEHSVVFEKLTEIITRYGLPSTNAADISTQVNMPAKGPPQVLSHKKQNLIYVELLIKAHQCFISECSMEGIANVLNRAKALNTVLTNAKSWSLIVRMLIGIARYREMFYCFHSLIKHDQFESLLGQFEEEKTIGLRQAILAYLREYSPENARDYLKLAALHFLMYKDLAEMWEQDARMVLAKVVSVAQVTSAQLQEKIAMASLTTTIPAKITLTKLKCTPQVLTLLHQALENYTHATENYLLDSKLLLAQKSAWLAEMVALQIDLVSKALHKGAAPQICVSVISAPTSEEFRELVNAELGVAQSLILSRAYGFDINWTEALLSQFILLNHPNYLNEYLSFLPLKDSTIESVVKGFQLYAQNQKPSQQMEDHLAHLVDRVRSVVLKYKLASLLSLKSIVMALLDDQTIHYLKDTNQIYDKC